MLDEFNSRYSSKYVRGKMKHLVSDLDVILITRFVLSCFFFINELFTFQMLALRRRLFACSSPLKGELINFCCLLGGYEVMCLFD